MWLWIKQNNNNDCKALQNTCALYFVRRHSQSLLLANPVIKPSWQCEQICLYATEKLKCNLWSTCGALGFIGDEGSACWLYAARKEWFSTYCCIEQSVCGGVCSNDLKWLTVLTAYPLCACFYRPRNKQVNNFDGIWNYCFFVICANCLKSQQDVRFEFCSESSHGHSENLKNKVCSEIFKKIGLFAYKDEKMWSPCSHILFVGWNPSKCHF